jgi:flagellar hook-associated protein 3 FlgL
MITGLNASNNLFLTSVDNLQTQLNNTQNQLSTGYRVNQASDAPGEVGDIFEARADLSKVNQTIQNLNSVQAQVNAGDSSLQTAIQLLQNANTLGSQGASTGVSQTQLNNLASQVQSVLSQLVGISATQVNGVYIFGGDASGSPPYQLDPASPTGVDQLTTAGATQQVADPSGITFQTSLTAQQIFDAKDSLGNPTSQNAFAALNNLQLALQSGNTTNIGTALDGVQSASDFLNQQLGFYGAAENRITSALNLAQKFQVGDQTQLSNLQDTDVTSAAIQVTQDTTALNAAMAAQAKKPTSTLFDYLPITNG